MRLMIPGVSVCMTELPGRGHGCDLLHQKAVRVFAHTEAEGHIEGCRRTRVSQSQQCTGKLLVIIEAVSVCEFSQAPHAYLCSHWSKISLEHC